MKTEHTNGPWKVLEHARGRGRTCVTTSNGAPVHAVICEIDTKSIATDEAIRLANANLIAAAPDLLAALKAISDYVAMMHGHRGGDISENAIAAINKAEGNA